MRLVNTVVVAMRKVYSKPRFLSINFLYLYHFTLASTSCAVLHLQFMWKRSGLLFASSLADQEIKGPSPDFLSTSRSLFLPNEGLREMG
jgi:hypothetical protein